MGNIDAEKCSVIDPPAWRWNLRHTHIIEGVLRRIEIRIGPLTREQRGPDCICATPGPNVDGVSDRDTHGTVCADRAVASDHDIEGALVGLALLVQPALDDRMRLRCAPSPLICVTSIIGSQRMRVSAQARFDPLPGECIRAGIAPFSEPITMTPSSATSRARRRTFTTLVWGVRSENRLINTRSSRILYHTEGKLGRH